ncbi:uncharacterized protein LOC117651806 [Thrips palmi]|uniref:Uncharacterized protein LOC117651806 n=1 Tax=Thrips palmi TaxID=161013 RepID=A0A6P9A4A0_THRPL|nr:uncharacterized protein LOC117651806 [Thrips palmi]
MSEESDETEMTGHHEEFDFALSDEYKINELKLEVEELKKELTRRKQREMHLMWHCMMYRIALRYAPGGSSTLRDTLDAFHENPQRFHSCCCCETEDLTKLVKAQRSENTGQEKSSKSTSELDDYDCSNCKNDSLIMQLNESV